VNRAADPQARQFTVRAIMSNTEGLFKPGMFAHVSIVIDKLAGAVAVPREAVKTDDAGDYVTVVDDANKASRRQVTTGVSDAAYIGITEGLRPGERVVTLAGVPVKDGTVVNAGAAGAGSDKAGGQYGSPGGATKSGS
jgi:cobalt-zinc-cadmium efflux system membrane fusion protein